MMLVARNKQVNNSDKDQWPGAESNYLNRILVIELGLRNKAEDNF